MYSPQVLQHFKNPHNQGKIDNPTVVGEVGNPVCGDIMKLYLLIENNIIKDIKFETLGCAAAIATSSMLTDLAKGKTVEQAAKITKNSIADALGGLPAVKLHCSMLAVEALQKAIDSLKRKT